MTAPHRNLLGRAGTVQSGWMNVLLELYGTRSLHRVVFSSLRVCVRACVRACVRVCVCVCVCICWGGSGAFELKERLTLIWSLTVYVGAISRTVTTLLSKSAKLV